MQSIELLCLCIPDDGKQIAADAARHRLEQTHRGIGGDRRIDRVATVLEDIEADLRRQRMAVRDHAVIGERNRAAGLERRRRVTLAGKRGGGDDEGEHGGEDGNARGFHGVRSTQLLPSTPRVTGEPPT